MPIAPLPAFRISSWIYFKATLQWCLPDSVIQNQIFFYSLFYILYTSHCLLHYKILLSVSASPTRSWTIEGKKYILCISICLIAWRCARCHIGLLNPVAFGENSIHLHIDSFHSVSLSWIYFRKWPPSPCYVSDRMLGIPNECHNPYGRKLCFLNQNKVQFLLG